MELQTILLTLLVFIVIFIFFVIIGAYIIRKKQIFASSKRKYMSYQQDKTWQQLQQHLPPEYHITHKNQPIECFWDWGKYQIHLDTYPNAKASAKIILLHGAGTNGRQMSLILGQPLAALGYEVISIDLPGYGLTKVKNRSMINYQEWVSLVYDFVNKEAKTDLRPIFLFGASFGGMLALHVAMRNAYVKGIIGLTFLDLNKIEVQKSTMRFSPFSDLTLRSMDFVVKTRFKKLRLPMALVSKMYALTNNQEALKILMKDPLSAANTMSVHFLESYVNYKPIGAFPDFVQCPVLLAQPEADLWTPIELSKAVLDQLKIDYKVKILPHGSHYPLEKEALDTLVHSSVHFIETYK